MSDQSRRNVRAALDEEYQIIDNAIRRDHRTTTDSLEKNLHALFNPVALAVLQLHKRIPDEPWCAGCEPTRWPCPTVLAIAGVYDIPVPR